MIRTKENITTDQFTAIQHIYNYFNAELFGGELNSCLLNLSRKSKAMGFFAPNRWGKEGETSTIHEISLNPEFLRLGVQETLQTMVHEMVHCWQQDFDKPANGYHNKAFATKMKSVGLQPSTTGMPGGKETGKKMADYAIEGGIFLDVVARMPKEYLYPFVCKPEVNLPKVGKNKTKYTCNGCDSNIWGKPGLHVECQECETIFSEN